MYNYIRLPYAGTYIIYTLANVFPESSLKVRVLSICFDQMLTPKCPFQPNVSLKYAHKYILNPYIQTHSCVPTQKQIRALGSRTENVVITQSRQKDIVKNIEATNRKKHTHVVLKACSFRYIYLLNLDIYAYVYIIQQSTKC